MPNIRKPDPDAELTIAPADPPEQHGRVKVILYKPRVRLTIADEKREGTQP